MFLSLFSSFMAFLMSFGLACMLAATERSKRGSVAISHSFCFCHVALSCVGSRHIRVFRLFTFSAFLSKTRQYTQDFIVPSNLHHNLDNGDLLNFGSIPQKRVVWEPIADNTYIGEHKYDQTKSHPWSHKRQYSRRDGRAFDRLGVSAPSLVAMSGD